MGILRKKPKDQDKIKLWQGKLSTSRSYYQDELDKMITREDIYNGRRAIDANPNIRKAVSKEASNVRNITFELIESQIDSNIPTCKATPRDALDENRAKTIEDILRNEIDRIKIESMNDEQERTCPMQGGSYFHIEWDNTLRTHTTIGELSIELLHPRQVILQAGVTEVQKCDYIFVIKAQTKDYIKRRYDVDVQLEEETDAQIRGKGGLAAPADDIVTQNIVYYRDDDGVIGKFSWVNNVVLEYMDDYQSRKQNTCEKCDADYPIALGKCPFCESDKAKPSSDEYEIIHEDILTRNGVSIPAKRPVNRDEYMSEVQPIQPELAATYEPPYEMIDEEPKEPRMEDTKIKYYKPDVFPIVLRRNVSASGMVLGTSDVDFIRDQQNATNKLLTKVEEKIFKAGSYVTLPSGVSISTTDEELKVIRYTDPSQINGIKVLNMQPEIGNDMAMINENYEYARQTLGITESFQGRRDTTATSGKAKEFAAAQSAGRLESKRRMKNLAYADLYEIMFKFLLAYTDEDRGYAGTTKTGEEEFRKFSRYDFIDIDDAGEFYYNDQFLFSTDSSGGLGGNREAMWQEMRDNFASRTFGNPDDIDTQIFYWKSMKKLHYPSAGDILNNLQAKKEEMEQAEAAAQAPTAGLTPNAMLGGAPAPPMIPDTGGGVPSVM